ncbi:MAG TPA: thioredoxin [Gemmatales bacterium]|nr:thioredoxin [Gemmatales bacterium]
MAAKNVVELNQDNWQSAVVDSALPVVVDFWAVWCGPCLRIAPLVENLADEYAGKVVVGKVNTDDNHDLAAQFRINTIPQVLVFKNGQEVERLIGVQSKTSYTAAVEKVLKS